MDLNAHTMNASDIHYICHVLLCSNRFECCTTIHHHISASIILGGMSKKRTIMSHISGTHWTLDCRDAWDADLKTLCRWGRHFTWTAQCILRYILYGSLSSFTKETGSVPNQKPFVNAKITDIRSCACVRFDDQPSGHGYFNIQTAGIKRYT